MSNVNALAKSLRSPFFATADDLVAASEAYWVRVNSLPKSHAKAELVTAAAVLFNTLAKEIEEAAAADADKLTVLRQAFLTDEGDSDKRVDKALRELFA
jgi:hypothetical protein